MMGFRRNIGLRIDHILLVAPLAATVHGLRWTRRRASWSGLPTMPR
jgi:exonuclease III